MFVYQTPLSEEGGTVPGAEQLIHLGQIAAVNATSS